MAGDFKEWKPDVKRDRKIWEFQRGYHVYAAGRHENNDQFNAFQAYLHGKRSFTAVAEQVGSKAETIAKWAKKYEWERRAASWDSKEVALAIKDANKLERRRQRDSIEEYRKANEDQAKMMMETSKDLMEVIQKRVIEAQMEGEKIPLGLLSGLMRAAASMSDAGRQSWATALGVGQLMQVVETELEEAQVEILDEEEDEAYDIPIEVEVEELDS